MKTAFHSHWRASLQEFLDFKRLGYLYQTQEAVLRSFDHFAGQHPRMPLPDLVRQWLARIPDRQPATVERELLVVRQFCLFRRRFDSRSFVPDRIRLAPSALPRFRPYPLSTAQIKMLLQGTSRSLRRSPVFRARIRTLLLVLYCTGLRIGEAVHLHLADVDLKRAYFRVGPSKGRIRLVPFGRDLAAELNRWLALRRRFCSHASDNSFRTRGRKTRPPSQRCEAPDRTLSTLRAEAKTGPPRTADPRRTPCVLCPSIAALVSRWS
jgi:site-specific recombinase XerD